MSAPSPHRPHPAARTPRAREISALPRSSRGGVDRRTHPLAHRRLLSIPSSSPTRGSSRFYYFFTIALGSFFWVTLHYACDSDWSVLRAPRVGKHPRPVPGPLPHLHSAPLARIRRRPLEMDGTGALERPRTRHPQRLAQPALLLFPLRLSTSLYFILAGLYYRRSSVQQDADGNPDPAPAGCTTTAISRWSSSACSQTFLGFDWLWVSTGAGPRASSASTTSPSAPRPAWPRASSSSPLLRSAGYLQTMNHEHFYLMGKLLFGFTIFWAYIAFGQYLLIWYANIPEETIFYNDHNRGDWIYLTYFLAVGQIHLPGDLSSRAGQQEKPARAHLHRRLDPLHARRRALLVHHALRAPRHVPRAGRISSPSSPSARSSASPTSRSPPPPPFSRPATRAWSNASPSRTDHVRPNRTSTPDQDHLAHRDARGLRHLCGRSAAIPRA